MLQSITLKWNRETYILETIPLPPRIQVLSLFSREIPQLSKKKGIQKNRMRKPKVRNRTDQKCEEFWICKSEWNQRNQRWEKKETKNYKSAKDIFIAAKDPESILTNISWLKLANEALEHKLESKRVENVLQSKDSIPYERSKQRISGKKNKIYHD